ncbi:MAG: signal recognition particle-docking protein FtsY [Gammaproteobacteria bacterium]|nr:signal recognition particle-docking protein FtsY [Gammaproteobacteria bacterium]MYA65863.1 signal recognition particle-docking protein FtsY [Gammaproteobacteria bacterium]MYG95334.1 signal recognition particle-docking protein FtsY [Gammaproteobacteria bacterium]MYH46693.1 signal recognition particle-docking protein FtsY [Gammaproteobacteria bacterium]MYL13179.1 signal recognition particle-docking protein FtsY [Gammaproteobacteria bacterium]
MLKFGKTSRSGEEPGSGAERSGLFSRLKQGLNKTGSRLRGGVAELTAGLAAGNRRIDAELLEDVETRLLSADVGLEATDQVIAGLQSKLDRRRLSDSGEFVAALKDELTEILAPCEQPLQVASKGRPFVILMVGVNGAGKTTTIGKLARRLRDEGHSVMLAAGDTFRAAAVEQLQAWGERNDVPVVAQAAGADSAAVIFDAWQSARAKEIDVLIADTAGRLHTRDNLMRELEKIVRVLRKQDEGIPDEILLVLDATTGQNAVNQAESFHKSTSLSGIVLTKLDGTAKGGVVFAIARRFGIPLRFIGIGEQASDLRPFAAREFVEALFSD